jgi:methionyl-tRNA formyltransferase
MNIIVFGSTDLTFSVLEFLYRNKYKVSAIVTVPQIFKISYQPKGIKNSRFIDLNSWAKQKNIPIFFYNNSNQIIKELQYSNIVTDFAIVVGWYHMVPSKLRNLFSNGCSGFHASLLPKLRGGAPLNWAILSDLKETGVSFFELSDGVDDGMLYDQEKFSIEPSDNISNIIDKSKLAILKMLKRTLPKIINKQNILRPQIGTPSYCGQRKPEDGLIDWKMPVIDILRLIRASSKPYPGAYTFLDNQKIIIWKAQLALLKILGVPGQISLINKIPYISCGNNESLLIDNADDIKLLLKSNHKRLCNENS